MWDSGARVVIRKAIILVLTLAAVATVAIGALSACSMTRPMIIFAWGFGADLHILRPLNQLADLKSPKRAWNGDTLGWLLNRLFVVDEACVNDNWTGQWLYVDGYCGVCGNPYAARGSFVLAALPGGLAYATWEPSPRYQHMTRPTYVRWPWVVAVALTLAAYPMIAFVRGPLRRRRRRKRGLCVACGYDLTGNVSGVCSECGRRVKML